MKHFKTFLAAMLLLLGSNYVGAVLILLELRLL